MKKRLAALFVLAVAVVFVSSCRAKHGTCAAYSQAPVVKKQNKNI